MRGTSWRAALTPRVEPHWRDPRITLQAIADMFGICTETVRKIAAEQGWPSRDAIRLEGRGAAPRGWVGKPCPGLAECPERSRQVAQAFGLAQQQMAKIEQRFEAMAADAPASEGERAAKALAIVVGTLKELMALDAAAAAPKAATPAREISDADVDALRAQIARTISGGAEGGEAAGGDQPRPA